MKRIITIIGALFLFGGLTLQAAPVTPERALDVAKKVFAAQSVTKSVGNVKIIWDGEFEVATKSAQPAIYVVARDGGGFVIVAGDDNVQPVLAFSDRNPFAFEGMPENVKVWMEYIKGYVRSANSRTPEVARQWEAFVDTKAALPGPFANVNDDSATCEWNQSAPANVLAPTVSGQSEQSVCGCLPLAMAEILTWFGWPQYGVSGLSEAYTYTANNGTSQTILPFDLSCMNISPARWSELQALQTYADFRDCTGDVRDTLSALVYACGVVLQAWYNDSDNGGTSASNIYVADAFSSYFQFNKGAYLDYCSDHAPSAWNAILKSQVLQYPVLYCGLSNGVGNDAGHAYVLDGYATYLGDDVFHFNFGWGANCNGYYYATYQNTAYGYNFNMELSALLNFYPDRTGTSEYVNRLSLTKVGGYTGFDPNVTIEKDVPFPLQVGAFINQGARFTGTSDDFIMVCLYDKNDNIKEYNLAGMIPLNGINIGPGGGFGVSYAQGWNAEISEDLVFGDKVVLLYTCDDGTISYDGYKWAKMSGPADGSLIMELPVMPAAFIATENEYHVGDFFVFALKNNNYTYDASLWFITVPSGTQTGYYHFKREIKLTEPGKYMIQAMVFDDDNYSSLKETIVTYITVKP